MLLPLLWLSKELKFWCKNMLCEMMGLSLLCLQDCFIMMENYFVCCLKCNMYVTLIKKVSQYVRVYTLQSLQTIFLR